MQSLASKQQEYLTMKALYVLALIPAFAFATPPHNPPSNPSTPSSSSESNSAALGLGVGVGIGEGGDATAIGKGGDATAVGVGQGGNAHGGDAVSGSLSSAHQGQSSTNVNGLHNDTDVRNASTNVNGQHTNVETGDVRNTNTLGNDSRNTNANEAAAASTASNDGNSLSTAYDSDFTSLALALGSVTGAQVDPSICRATQTAGWRVTLIERTGRNKYNQECLGQVLNDQLEQADFNRCMDIANAYLKVRLEAAFAAQLEKCGGVLERALITSSLALREPVPQVGTPISEEIIDEKIERAFNAAQSK